ncbi:probable 39S ribosomal protein L49, mitochondrial [Leptopilina boulardi]|uniref:probable 39S ribosomal protein L49, mitochondrial n=1 Tax=Leptopilina boulardi TaxID=63433 RepID=UPI0021F6961D|nr:probable 39S ribosomal protein L49, mitochondrial [Leptopilina boulardi]
MASLRILTRSKLSSILYACCKTESQRIVSPVILETQKRWSYYLTEERYKDPSKYTKFEITSDPNEWKYVERLLPYKVVPVPPNNIDVTASGWKPQNAPDTNLPYFVPRTKNYMHPVYMVMSKRGMKKLTYVRKIQGDIWQLESELKEYLQKRKVSLVNVVSSRINELAGVIIFRGDYVSQVNRWLEEKGF